MILDIKTLADSLINEVGTAVEKLKNKPHLTIIMVGDDSASDVYVKNKIKTCEKVGITTTLLHLPDTVTEPELAQHIEKLNEDSGVTGILVQSPLPSHIDAQKMFDLIEVKKDVDGFSSINTARLYSGDENGLVPGTPKGIIEIIKHQTALEGKNVIVIGKSTIVGKPLAMLLLHAGATVTICHSRTRDLKTHTQSADIIVSAVGKKHLIRADMVKPGALVIDVGINVEQTDKGRKLFGDCDTDTIAQMADITPVPGGVGPMTIAMLLTNVLTAHTLQGKH